MIPIQILIHIVAPRKFRIRRRTYIVIYDVLNLIPQLSKLGQYNTVNPYKGLRCTGPHSETTLWGLWN
ncbi:hypothetical protein EYZ11_009439 [Aspergillus tanneri]|uniref:Uncharacterized protein n=1 Tax=Aspergillus tanneri TaxID=1220188 RepID=A0A4S3J8C6_9EURO|nr:hypothetical protein EYZ11_009439 [Aspergillus tanneri]